MYVHMYVRMCLIEWWFESIIGMCTYPNTLFVLQMAVENQKSKCKFLKRSCVCVLLSVDMLNTSTDTTTILHAYMHTCICTMEPIQQLCNQVYHPLYCIVRKFCSRKFCSFVQKHLPILWFDFTVFTPTRCSTMYTCLEISQVYTS